MDDCGVGGVAVAGVAVVDCYSSRRCSRDSRLHCSTIECTVLRLQIIRKTNKIGALAMVLVWERHI